MPFNDIVGQNSMDSFYQHYKTNADFFDIDDFIRYTGIAWGAICKKNYDERRAEMRSEKEEGFVTFSRDWLSEVELETKRDERGFYAEMKDTIMSFPFDPWASGLQVCEPKEGAGCGEFLRTSAATAWQLCYTPETNVTFYYLETRKRIRFFAPEWCVPKKVTVFYVPASDNEQYYIPDTLEEDVIQLCVMLMFRSKEGRGVIKSVDDLNPNSIPQTETNLVRPE